MDKSAPLAIARLVESTEAAAMADLLRAAPAGWQTQAEETPAGTLLLAPTVDMLLFNRLVGCGVDRPARRDELLAAIARLRAGGVKNFGVPLNPAARPVDIPAWLAEAGLTRRDRWAKVYRGADPAAAVKTDLQIQAVEAAQAPTFAAVVATGFGMPPLLRPWIAAAVGRPNWRHYLAWDGAEPVGGGALFVHGEAGWLGVASTLPEARRRGAQGALMARRIEDGRALGCRWFVTETGEDTPSRPNPSFRNMLRAGFTLAYQRDNFMPPAP